MRWNLYISFLILLLASCGPSKKIVTSSSIIRDTIAHQDSSMNSLVQSNNTFRQTKDRVLTVDERTVDQNLTSEDIKPVYTNNGKAVTRTFHQEGKGIQSTVTVNADGSVKFNCKADSLLLVVKGLDSTVIIQKDSTSYWRGQYILKSMTHAESKETTKVYGVEWIIKWAVIMLIIIGILGYLIKRFA